MYRSHDMTRHEFVHSNINTKNHNIVEDFNIDILNNEDTVSQEFLSKSVEK